MTCAPTYAYVPENQNVTRARPLAKGCAGVQDYGFRLYSPAIGRFLSTDPLTRAYPELTPYQFASNTPIQAIDIDGLEAGYVQVAGRIGISGDVIPGPTVAGAVGIAYDGQNLMTYFTPSGGASLGAYAGGGVELGLNPVVDNVDGLLGWGINVGAVAGTGPNPFGVQFGGEINLTLPTLESGMPDFSSIPEEAGAGGTIAITPAGRGWGFLGYIDASYTVEIARYDVGNPGDAINDLAAQAAEYGIEFSEEMLQEATEGVERMMREFDELYPEPRSGNPDSSSDEANEDVPRT